MAIEKQSYIERVLIVLNPDGSIKGAHQERLTRILEAEAQVVYSEIQESAEVLTPQALAGVLPQKAALIAQIAEQAARIDELTAQIVAASLH